MLRYLLLKPHREFIRRFSVRVRIIGASELSLHPASCQYLSLSIFVSVSVTVSVSVSISLYLCVCARISIYLCVHVCVEVTVYNQVYVGYNVFKSACAICFCDLMFVHRFIPSDCFAFVFGVQ